MLKRSLTLLVAMGLAFCGMAHAQQPAAPGKPPLPTRLRLFLNNQTAILVHVNLDQIDTDALATFVSQSLSNTGFPPDSATELAHSMRDSKARIKQYGEKGFHDVYVVVSVDVSPAGMPPIVFIVPMAAGVDEPNFRQDLVEMVAPSGLAGKSPETMKLNGAMAVGPPQVIADATALVGRHETRMADANALVAALDSVGRHTVDIVVAPTPDMRRVVAELMPKLPPQVGGGNSDVIAEGVRYVAVTLKFPPAPQLTLRVQADTAARAAQLLEVWISMEKALTPLVATMPVEIRATATEVLAAVRPKVEQSQLTTVLDSPQLAQLALLFLPALQASRETALRAKSSVQERQLIVVGIRYASDHQNEWPDDLNAELLTKYGMKEDALKNPRHPEQSPGYIYLKPKAGSTGNGDRIVLYEKTPATDDGVAVGFADGHVEWQTMKNFQDALKKQQAEDAAKK